MFLSPTTYAAGTTCRYNSAMERLRRLVFALCSTVLGSTLAATPVAARILPVAPALGAISANQNVAPGGSLQHGRLRIALVARRGLWRPDGPGTLGLPIEAFGEAGRPLQIPGPLVRVPLGTRVEASVRNELPHDIFVRGLSAPAGAAARVLRVRRGAIRRVTFLLDKPGTFGYYASTTGETVDSRIFDDAELSGAIVVDAPHVPRIDHVFVLGVYAPVRRPDGSPHFIYLLETINGRSFPATERLVYQRGRRVRWGVYNASSLIHPMHLHGFFFRTDRPDAYDEVTHPFYPGDAEVLSWTADRAGDWMFHCHIDDHITRHAPLRAMLARKPDPQLTVTKRYHLANQPMASMVVAVSVLPGSHGREAVAASPARTLALDINSDVVPGAQFGLSRDSFKLTENGRTASSTGSLGPPIVLTQGAPVAIAVTNHMSESTSIHWHGIALENSYFDGGAGMGMASMSSGRMPPAIAPGDTFVARFVPPDAGTFTYHSHLDDGWQLAGGLSGPLIVLPRGQEFDGRTDHIVMISEFFSNAGRPPLAINGFAPPPAIVAHAGTAQRLRFANLTLAGQNLVVSLCDGARVLQWSPIAKDGRDMPLRLQRPGVATHALTIGETRDFRFTPERAGTLTLNVYDADDNGALVASQRIDVSGP